MPERIDAGSAATEARIGALQDSFAAALLRVEADIPDGLVAASPAQRVKRFGVYRNNVHATLAAALAARFPVVERLVGPEFFRATALVFIRQQPPYSPVLANYGDGFASFLESFEPAAELPYLPDVARLEWARNRAYHAADAAAADIAMLAAIAPEALAGVRLAIHPAVFVLSSPYPIVSIWATNTHDVDVRPISVDAGGECALVTRPALEVLVTPLSRGDAIFAAAIAQKKNLGAAAEEASNTVADFDLAAALAALFQSGAVTHALPPADPATLGYLR